jgi:hypothetical protein
MATKPKRTKTTSPANNTPANNTKEEIRFLCEIRLHAENVLTSRTNFFLVAQSFFAVAAATLVSGMQNSLSRTLLIFIVFGGLVVSCVWFLLGFKIFFRLGAFDDTLKALFPKYKKIIEEEKFCISSNIFIAFVIPGLFALGWILLFSIY